MPDRFLHDRPDAYGQRAARVETYLHAVSRTDLYLALAVERDTARYGSYLDLLSRLHALLLGDADRHDEARREGDGQHKLCFAVVVAPTRPTRRTKSFRTRIDIDEDAGLLSKYDLDPEELREEHEGQPPAVG